MMTSGDQNIIDQLEQPGAGVPFFQRLLLRYIVAPFVAAKSDWDTDSRNFEKINEIIFSEIAGLDEAQLQQRVLVPRQAALEDSSRYWSIAMTIEHLLIVGGGIKKGVIALSQGIVPPRKIDTAKVKPQGGIDAAQVIADYKLFVTSAIKEIDEAVVDKKSQAKIVHPWFGPMTAHQMHWLLAAHANIHLKQIRQIIKNIK